MQLHTSVQDNKSIPNGCRKGCTHVWIIQESQQPFYLSTCPHLNIKNRCNFYPFKTSRFSQQSDTIRIIITLGTSFIPGHVVTPLSCLSASNCLKWPCLHHLYQVNFLNPLSYEQIMQEPSACVLGLNDQIDRINWVFWLENLKH